MSNTNLNFDSAIEELNRANALPVYEAFDVAWLAVIKMSNLLSSAREEDDRLKALLERIPENTARLILHQQQIDTLINLEPPLEAVLSSPHERLRPDQTALALAAVKQKRAEDPKLAILELAKVLKRIRNRRAHGFKTAHGPRDTEILGSALWILRLVGISAAEAMGAE